MAEGEINIDNIIQRLLEGQKLIILLQKYLHRVPRYLFYEIGALLL